MRFSQWSKLQVHVILRWLKDQFGHDKFCKRRTSIDTPYSIEVSQPFTASSTLEQKKHNLRVAGKRIRRYVVLPGEVFSFWRCVGNPNTRQFALSRSIRGGVLQIERGGGLCQASGIIHHLSLIAGLEIVERYNHSKDLYTEETRFCPLGSDATVAYGYRDLRVRNTTSCPVMFDLQVYDDHFTGYLRSDRELAARDLEFERIDSTDGILKARVTDKITGELISESEYVKL